MRILVGLFTVLCAATCGTSDQSNWTAGSEACELVDGQVEVACSGYHDPATASADPLTAQRLAERTTYAITSPDIAHAYVRFVPSRSGLHTIFFGTTEELQVCDLTATCASTTTCADLPIVAQYAMEAGISYEIEVPSNVTDFGLRIDPPPFDMPPPPPPPPSDTDIVFAAALDGQAEPDLYRMHANGTGLVRLTRTSGAELYPTWSPSHDRIAFVRDFQLFVRDADGSNERLVSPMLGRIRYDSLGGVRATTLSHAGWSPDGTQLVYPYPLPPFQIEESPGVFVDESYGTTLHIIDADGTDDHAVPTLNETMFEYPFGTSFAPVWGTDGRILFEMDDDCPDCAGGEGYGSIRPDGTDFINVATLQLNIRHGLDSAAGKWVFVSDLTGPVYSWDYEAKGALYTAPAYGTVRTPLGPTSAWSPHWSPDGNLIAYIAEDGIWLIGANGAGAHRVVQASNVRGLDW